ncbi:MAG: DnaB-like helicase C-terminal domain-containing protein, partial [Myxococcota bacterium]|nr:DnaB-like helicase C-terminal domain-containing protein [Myxococcota bacterium]
LGLVVVDYLQLVRPAGRSSPDHRVQEVSEITQSLKALAKPRGPKGRGRDPVSVENEQLRKENARLRQRLKQAETILEIQKKTSELLGIPLNRPANADDE